MTSRLQRYPAGCIVQFHDASLEMLPKSGTPAAAKAWVLEWNSMRSCWVFSESDLVSCPLEQGQIGMVVGTYENFDEEVLAVLVDEHVLAIHIDYLSEV